MSESAEHFDYSFSAIPINEDFFEQAIVEYMVEHLGYEHLYGPDVERTDEKYHDVFLPGVLEESLEKVNPDLPRQAISEAILKLNSVEGGSFPQRNEQFSDYVQSGVEVRFFDGKEERNELVWLIDYDEPENNSFYVVNQWTYIEHENKRPDIVVFVNGMPLVVFELKSPSREETDASDAYVQLRNYMKAIPSFFVPNAFCVMSDLTQTKAGTITAPEDRFSEWKSIDGDYSKNSNNWKVTLEGMFRKERLIDILHNFICFNDDGGKVVKILAAYHQYFGVHKAADRAVEAVAGDGRIGVFWHTQGSGKSLSMVFLAHMLQDRIESPTIVVVTDRNDLDDQLFGQFSRCSKFLRQKPVQAKARDKGPDNLHDLLSGRQANGIVFTTMQKFEEGDGALCDRSNVVVMIDEAHRGQYGLTENIKADGTVSIGAAKLIRDALPRASYIGFTGTPIALEGRNTQEVFGDYIDVYDMTQAVEDKATVPVFYESRVVALHLDSDALEQLDREYGEFAAEHDEASAEKSKHVMSGLDEILGAPDTIDALCRDIVQHYEENRADILTGKAMIVAYSRPIAMKIYYKLMELRPDWKEKVGVVMTSDNKDPEEWYEIVHGKPKGGGGRSDHKKEMERKFKSDDDPMKIAIVVDMWLTGFDVPSLSTMYMYKPMRGHNLMQAIARVNRVYKGKEGGLIVDYIGIATALKNAMKSYTNRDRRNYGDMDIAKTAYPKFQEKLEVCRDLLHGFDYRERIFTKNKEQLADCIVEGTDWLLEHGRETTRDDFLKQAQLLAAAESLCKSMVSESDQHEAAFIEVLRVQVMRILGKTGGGGNGMTYKEFNKRVSAILEQSVKSYGVINLFEDGGVEVSLFDESFLEEIRKMKEKNIALETLKRLIKEQVRRYGRTSVVKAQKFSEMLQKSVNGYLNGMLTNAEVIEELLSMAKEMMREREEGAELGLNREELAFYDALTKPQAVKDFYSNDQLIAITKELTEALRKNATIDWREKRSARAGMRRAIKHLLKRYKYPPEDQPEAIETVMKQCELWADTQVEF
jgi:type I restriction enzyme R subunit